MDKAPGEIRHRYVALDSLRGVCACMVVLLHFVTQGYISGLPIVQNGFLFIDFFFVLSGFVIGSSYGDRIAAGYSVSNFMWLRLGRIYPLHLFVLLAFVAFEIFFSVIMPQAGTREPFSGAYSPWAFLQSLLLVQIFWGPDGLTWNGPSWSIAAEMWTYLFFALCFRFAGRALIPICAFVVLAAPILLAANSDRFINVFHDGALVRCLFGFALGLVGWRCAEVVRNISIPSWGNHVAELAMVAAVIAFVSIAGSGPLSLAAPLLFFVAVLVFCRESGWVSRLLSFSPFVLLGALSYSIYMIHSFLHYRLLNVLDLLSGKLEWALTADIEGQKIVGGSAIFGDAMTFLFLALVIACSYMTYRFIEQPGQMLAKRLLRDWGKGALPAAPRAP